MNRATIDGAAIHSRSALHEHLAAALGLPIWYGHNLDALYDCLTDLYEDTQLELVNQKILMERLGGYGQRLLLVLERAQAENPHFRLLQEETDLDAADLTIDQEAT